MNESVTAPGKKTGREPAHEPELEGPGLELEIPPFGFEEGADWHNITRTCCSNTGGV